MRTYLGMQDARTTGSGNDQGIDVVSDRGVAQVKHTAVPVGGPTVQSALGAGHGNVAVLFLSLSGFTRQAEEFGERAGVALFSFDIYGDVRPHNVHARLLVTLGGRKRTLSVEDVRLKKLREKALPAMTKMEQRRSEVDALAAELENTTGLESDSRTLACIVGEYAGFLHTIGAQRLGTDKLLEILDDARAGRTRMGIYDKPELIPVPAVEAGCQGLIELYEEIDDIESLRLLTASKWVKKFFDWDIRREHINYLIEYARFSPLDKEPPLEAIQLQTTIEMDSKLNYSIASRWLDNFPEGVELSSFLAAAKKDPIGREPDHCKGLLEHFWLIELEDEDTPPAYPLGYEAHDIERVRQALNPQ